MFIFRDIDYEFIGLKDTGHLATSGGHTATLTGEFNFQHGVSY